VSFITSLFSGTEGNILPMLFALGIVIVLIVLAVWVLKFVFNVSSGVTRGRNRRLALVEALALDPKRQLLIVRRDNVEHLILTGGPQDVVVETGFAPEELPAARPTRRPVPTVPGRRSPRHGAAPEPTLPVPTPPVVAEPEPRAPRSLRHTGLLRPVEGPETPQSGQNPDIATVPPADSAKEDDEDQTRQDGTVDDASSSQAHRG